MYEGGCHHQDEAAAWYACAKHMSACSDAQMEAMFSFEVDFIDAFSRAAEHLKPSDAAFIHSYHDHCAGDSAAFTAQRLRDRHERPRN